MTSSVIIGCQQQDSNLRPFAYETSALPLSYADLLLTYKLYYNRYELVILRAKPEGSNN